MKQGVLITAHNNPEHLLDLINYFEGKFSIYLHIDKRSLNKLDWTEIIHHPDITYINTEHVPKWSSWNILQSNMQLIHQALQNPELEYFHMLSGQDFPCKSLDNLIQFSEANKNQIFMQHEAFPAKHLDDGGRDRYSYFHLNHWIDQRKHSRIHQWIINGQKKMRISRRLPAEFPPLYLGSAWWSMPRNALTSIDIHTNQHPQFYNWLKFTKFPDEIYIPTLLADSSFTQQIQEGIRYIRWEVNNSGSPAELAIEDFEAIVTSPYFFARKFGNDSAALRKKLMGHFKPEV
ncbi:MAG: hypothetical protein JXR19_08080 [Bacteroidia bacterium]